MARKSHKWDTLYHKGPLFPEAYKHRKFFAGGIGPLSVEAEEMMYHYAARLETEHVKNPVFNKNFFNSVSPFLDASLQTKKFPQDFQAYLDGFFSLIQEEKANKASLSPEEKEAEKAERLRIKKEYGFATMNGKQMPLGSFMIEPAGIFIGRGSHPLHGMWKPQAQPEEITINISVDGEVPPPPAGHHWKAVVENHNATWCAFYKIPVTGANKFMWFGAASEVKQNNDLKKFENARSLLIHWDEVKNHIDAGLSAKEPKRLQCAMIAYLIMTLGIRVGDEKGEDAADTVGASTLRGENLSLKDGHKISLDFLGKDSVRYTNEVTISAKAYKVLEEFIRVAGDRDYIFPNASSLDTNRFLQEALPSLTAKQFRTAHGSNLLSKYLRETKVDASASTVDKLDAYNQANFAVAQRLNHKRAVSKNFEEMMARFDERVQAAKTSLADYEETSKATLLDIEKTLELAKKTLKGDSLEKKKAQLKEKKDKVIKKLTSMKDRVRLLEMQEKLRADTKEVALATSRTSYSDPRLTVSWCKDKGFPLEQIYSKTLREKFSWAMDVDASFYKDYPEVI